MQAMQIHRLEQEMRRRSGVNMLQTIIELGEIAGATVGQAPYRVLLDGLAQAAQRLFNAGAASIALLDLDSNELVFEAATGAGNIVNRRFPAQQGIVGWVVTMGEALAVADVQRDPRFAQDFAQSTGYVPTSLLAVPLIVNDDVVGALEVLDKAGAASFGLDDMELLALFAQPAAIAVQQARSVRRTATLLVQELGRLAETQGEDILVQATQSVLAMSSTTTAHTLELARQIHSLGHRGERYSQLAIDILTSVARYAGDT
jgi:GAF domain-containing protein